MSRAKEPSKRAALKSRAKEVKESSIYQMHLVISDGLNGLGSESARVDSAMESSELSPEFHYL